jgi:hypothetical protein
MLTGFAIRNYFQKKTKIFCELKYLLYFCIDNIVEQICLYRLIICMKKN